MPKPVLEALFQTVTKAMQLPPKAWLADEMKHWENITSTVKIDIAK